MPFAPLPRIGNTDRLTGAHPFTSPLSHLAKRSTQVPPSRHPADLWLLPHRPFLAAAALWAGLAVLWWQWGAQVGLGVPVLGTHAFWHAHEMIFGMAGAAAAGYLLTALASWTGHPPPSGRVLQLLAALWLTQRAAMAGAALLPPAVAVLPGLGFFGLFALVLATGIIRARAWSKLGFAAAIAALGLGDAAMIRAALSGAPLPDPALMLRAGLLLFALLISVIGGRMVPAFTDNWLRQRGDATGCRPTPVADIAGHGLIALGAALIMGEAPRAGGAVLVLAGAAQAGRMAFWRIGAARREPLLLLLQAGFAWLPVGLVLLGAARLAPATFPESTVLHALTMGAMGGMILAIAARAAARRDTIGPNTGLRAGWQLVAAGACLWLSVWPRLAVALWPGAAALLNGLAAAAWCLGWALFLSALIPTLTGPAIRPVFSGPRGSG